MMKTTYYTVTTQISPENYYGNMVEGIDSTEHPVSPPIIQYTYVEPRRSMELTDADKFLIFGGIAVVAMVGLVVVAWHRDNTRRDVKRREKDGIKNTF